MTQPGSLSSVAPDGADWLVRRLRELERRVDELTTARTLEAATIGAGGLIVDGGNLKIVAEDGTLVANFGKTPINDGSGRTQTSVLLGRDDGTLAIGISDSGTVPGHEHQQAAVWLDRNGRECFADDTVSGHGIATPWFSDVVFGDTDYSRWPRTNSGSWTTIQSGYYTAQHPRLQFDFQYVCDPGTTGSFKVQCGGVDVGTVKTDGEGAYKNQQEWGIELPSSVSVGNRVSVSLLARVDSGTGNAYGQFLRFAGDQSY